MGAPAAIVDASGFIWAISGTSVAAAPPAPAAPVETKRKSRRVGSAADMVVTGLNPFRLASSRRRHGLPKRPSPHTTLPATTEAVTVRQDNDGHRGGLLAPLPAQRKGANAAVIRALDPWLMGLAHPATRPCQPDADRIIRTRYPAEHRHDPEARRLPGARSPSDRARGISDQRPGVSPRRNGLPR